MKIKNMLAEIFKIDRRLRIENKNLINSPFVNMNNMIIIDNYLTDFANYYNLSAKDIINYYYNFIAEYLCDVKSFISTGKYPLELKKDSSLNRLEYDVSLILSTAVSVHRHRIFNNIRNYSSKLSEKTLIIGVGSGLELEFLGYSNKSIDVYDIHIKQFLKERFTNIKLHEKRFLGKKEYYTNIIAIELLEHLLLPYKFISMCYKSLKKNGTFITTTATNVPQFDHLFNFKSDNTFKINVNRMGFKLIEYEIIHHNSLNKKLNAKNTWYVLKKK